MSDYAELVARLNRKGDGSADDSLQRHEAAIAIAALRSEVERLRADAELYRTWRDGAIASPSKLAVLLAQCIYAEDYDAAIDAAREG